MAKKETAAQVLERVRGEQDLTKDEFAAALGITRQWYHKVLTEGIDIDLKTLAMLAVDHVEDWRGMLAADLMRLYGWGLYIPCRCQTAVGDAGACLRHPRASVVAAEMVELAGVVR